MISIDDFEGHHLTASSMLAMLELLVVEAEYSSERDINDPFHDMQKMHSCVVGIRRQLEDMDRVVRAMGDSNG